MKPGISDKVTILHLLSSLSNTLVAQKQALA